MRRIRVIPSLLLRRNGLVKTVRFRKPVYVGDPINTVKIFNEKEVDELILLDIDASREGNPPRLQKIEEIAGECFMPLAYGGGITSTDQIKQILYAGAEKVILNTAFVERPQMITQAANVFGSQSVVVSIDARQSMFGQYRVYVRGGTTRVRIDPVKAAERAEQLGAGEIYINSIDRDGTFGGYDIDLVRAVADAVSIPVIAAGGARKVEDFVAAVAAGHASAVSAGSMFVFQGVHKAVLINFPDQPQLKEKLFSVVA